MLLSNSRINKLENIKFYEQDLLIDNNVFNGDIEVTLQVEYITPGIGIALISDGSLSLDNFTEAYLFKISHSEYSIVSRLGNKTKLIENGPALGIKPYKENIELKIKKFGNVVSIIVDGKELTKRHLPTDINTYSIGYYSNAGNVIKAISIASKVPDGWNINMSNTNGGYIKFLPNKFYISNCSDIAEVEQVGVELEENALGTKYYLKYDLENVEGKNDIKPYVFLSDDDRFNDEKKNILRKDNTFILKNTEKVNIKFKGTIGGVSNIQISDSIDDFYVETTYDKTEIEESYIMINTSEVEKIEWTGSVFNIPKDERYAIIQDYDRMLTDYYLNIKLGKDKFYDYSLVINGPESILTIKNDSETRTYVLNIKDNVKIFRNIDAIITKLLLYKTNGTVDNIINQDTQKHYVPATITSPIAIVTEEGEPLNLTSSFRFIENDKDREYLFTNVEREVFEVSNKIKLTNRPLNKLNTIKVYGIRKNSVVNEDKIFQIPEKGLDNIDSYSTSHDLIHESDLYDVDKQGKTITISNDPNEVFNKYKQLVVDYLKGDSYSINYNHELLSYEVDISYIGKALMYYDGAANNNSFSDIKDYKLFNADIKDNSYIVLKGRAR